MPTQEMALFPLKTFEDLDLALQFCAVVVMFGFFQGRLFVTQANINHLEED